jgi:hypothetical protein
LKSPLKTPDYTIINNTTALKPHRATQSGEIIALHFLEDNTDLFCFDLTTNGPEFGVVFRPHNGKSTESWPNFAAWVEECWLGELED